RLPQAHVALDRHRTSAMPAVQGAQVLDFAYVAFQFMQHHRDRSLRRATQSTVILERGTVLAKPKVKARSPYLVGCDRFISFDGRALVLPNSIRECGIVSENRALLPAIS